MAETQLMTPIVKEKLSNYAKINEMPDWMKGHTYNLGHPKV